MAIFLSLFKLRYLQSCTFQSPFPHFNDGKMARFALRENSSLTLGRGGYNFFFFFVVVVVFILFKIVASVPKFEKTKKCGLKIIKFLQNCSLNILEMINK